MVNWLQQTATNYFVRMLYLFCGNKWVAQSFVVTNLSPQNKCASFIWTVHWNPHFHLIMSCLGFYSYFTKKISFLLLLFFFEYVKKWSESHQQLNLDVAKVLSAPPKFFYQLSHVHHVEPAQIVARQRVTWCVIMYVRLPIKDTLKARNFTRRLCRCSCASRPCRRRRLMNRPPDAREADLWQWGISAPAATSSRRRHWQKPWHRNLFEKGGSVDSLGIIRINAGTWNKEMRHHNTDQLFISILCLARRISWVIMERQGSRRVWCWRIRARRNSL